MPQQSDIGRLLSALGGGLSTFAGAERLSREEKARRDAERISRNLSLAKFELEKHRGVQDIFGQREARTFRTSEREAGEAFRTSERGEREAFQSEQSEINRALQRELTELRGEAKDPNIEATRRANLENKAEVRAEKKIKKIRKGVTTEAQGLILKALRTTTPEGDKVPKVTNEDALVRLVSMQGQGLGRLGDLSRKLFQFEPDSAGVLNIRGQELRKVGLGELAPVIPKPKGVVRQDFRHPLTPVGGTTSERQKPKGKVLKGGTASETAKQIAAAVRKQKGKLSIKKLKALNAGQNVDAIIKEVDRIIGNTDWRTK